MAKETPEPHQRWMFSSHGGPGEEIEKFDEHFAKKLLGLQDAGAYGLCGSSNG